MSKSKLTSWFNNFIGLIYQTQRERKKSEETLNNRRFSLANGTGQAA